MEKNGDPNMWGVMDTIATTAVTIYFAKFEIIGTAIIITIISYNLTGAEKMKRCWKPEHVKDSEDEVWHNWKNNKCLDFSNDLCSNLNQVNSDKCSKNTMEKQITL